MTKAEFFTQMDFTTSAPVILDEQMHAFYSVMPGSGAYNFMDSNLGTPYLFTDPETGEQRLPLPRDLEFLLSTGRMKPIFMDQGRKPVSRPVDVDLAEIQRLDREAVARQLILRRYDENPVKKSDSALRAFGEELCSELLAAGLEKVPHPSTIRRWLAGRGTAGDRPLAVMVNMSGRVPRRRSFDPRTEAKLSESRDRFWLNRDMTEGQVIDEVQDFVDGHNRAARADDQLKRPSAETIRQRIRKSETAELYKQKFGDKAFRTKYRTPFDRRLNATQILDTGIVDHTVVDNMVVLSAKHRALLGRPILAIMVDVASRCILAHYITFEKPSLHTASQLLKRAVRPKYHLRKRFPDRPDGAAIYGLVSTLVYDRAIETIGVSHRDALADLGVEVVYAGAGEPQAKGIIERLFRTINKLLFHRLPGSVPLPASLMREMGYDPADTAVLTIEELEMLLEEAINVYHYQIHSSLGISPIQFWIDQGSRVRTLADPSVLDHMAGMVFMRTLDRSGVRLFNLQYCCEKNVPILLDAMAAQERTKRGKRKGSVTCEVKIKVNPENIGSIYVFNQHDKQYYELKCTDPSYADGTSLWQHKEIRKFAVARGNSFCSTESRRGMRLALAQSIEEACPEITLKAKRHQKRLEDAFLADRSSESPMIAADVDDDLRVIEIEVAPAATERADRGVPQHSPQRGKTARKANARRRPPVARKQSSTRTPLVAMSEDMLAAAASSWAAN
ncbi:transposase family protein [Novosphingobium sp. JCM 18896]|uniref:transposase family protein n=1 Tax=Novosphingobium sp. JCM 18896 TaxID=2989731 RepID=UPI002222066E|nr:transposase family protein [Novosphingobium sp. JCM 18896]MCW1432410.1 transposase family protein [Novosphingobium sp. JCM 18896]